MLTITEEIATGTVNVYTNGTVIVSEFTVTGAFTLSGVTNDCTLKHFVFKPTRNDSVYGNKSTPYRSRGILTDAGTNIQCSLISEDSGHSGKSATIRESNQGSVYVRSITHPTM